MNDLRKMLDEFENKYVIIQKNGNASLVHSDNELIHKILGEIVNRIENIERQVSKGRRLT